MTLVHVLDGSSPIAHWASPQGMQRDADAELVVVARVRREGGEGGRDGPEGTNWLWHASHAFT